MICMEDYWASREVSTPAECYDALNDEYGCMTQYFTFTPAGSTDDMSYTSCACCSSMYDPDSSSTSEMYMRSSMYGGDEVGYVYDCSTSSSSSYYMMYMPMYYSSVASTTVLLRDGSSLPSTCYNSYVSSGRCSSDLNYLFMYIYDEEECWSTCEDRFAADLVAVNYDPSTSECYCEDACDCLIEEDDGEKDKIKNDIRFPLPACLPASE